MHLGKIRLDRIQNGGCRGENDDVTALGRWAVRKQFVSGAYL